MLYLAGLFTVPALIVAVLACFFVWGVLDGIWLYDIKPALKRRGWFA